MLKQKFLILKQIEKYKNQMQQAVLEWNQSKFVLMRQKLDKLWFKYYLINDILLSKDFDTLIPLLKQYLNYGYK
jgi:hypothetical protein